MLESGKAFGQKTWEYVGRGELLGLLWAEEEAAC